jgi:hypothetical protein
MTKAQLEYTNERNKPVKPFLKKKRDISKGVSDSDPVRNH